MTNSKYQARMSRVQNLQVMLNDGTGAKISDYNRALNWDGSCAVNGKHFQSELENIEIHEDSVVKVFIRQKIRTISVRHRFMTTR